MKESVREPASGRELVRGELRSWRGPVMALPERLPARDMIGDARLSEPALAPSIQPGSDHAPVGARAWANVLTMPQRAWVSSAVPE